MSQFKGAQITEFRVYDNPDDPEHSDVLVVLPNTVQEAVFDSDGRSLDEVIEEIKTSIIQGVVTSPIITESGEKICIDDGTPIDAYRVIDNSGNKNAIFTEFMAMTKDCLTI